MTNDGNDADNHDDDSKDNDDSNEKDGNDVWFNTMFSLLRFKKWKRMKNAFCLRDN